MATISRTEAKLTANSLPVCITQSMKGTVVSKLVSQIKIRQNNTVFKFMNIKLICVHVNGLATLKFVSTAPSLPETQLLQV